MKQTDQSVARSLDVQRHEFSQRRLLAMPLAGTIVWALIGIAGAVLPLLQAVNKKRPKNTFDRLFIMSIVMSLLARGTGKRGTRGAIRCRRALGCTLRLSAYEVNQR
jgi:hypothetical protein